MVMVVRVLMAVNMRMRVAGLLSLYIPAQLAYDPCNGCVRRSVDSSTKLAGFHANVAVIQNGDLKCVHCYLLAECDLDGVVF